MKKTLSRTVAFGCSVLLMMSLALPVSAATAQNSHMKQVLEMDSTYEGFLANDDTLTYEEIASLPGASIHYEIDSIEEMKKMSDKELINLEMEENDIKKLRTESAKKIVLDNAAKLSKAALEDKGLSKEAIANLKSGSYEKLSEADVRAASSKLAFNIARVSRTSGQCNYNIYWHWDSAPGVKYTDPIAACISDGYVVQGSSTAKLIYKDENGYIEDTIDHIYPVYTGDGNVEFDIEMLHATSWGPQYCQAGKAFVANAGPVTSGTILINAYYFHSWTPDTVEVSFNVGSISFSGRGSKEGHSQYHA